MIADYIIVGAGSAGCAMAYRLSEDGKNKVIVVEYGGTDWSPLIQMPGALSCLRPATPPHISVVASL